MKKQFESYCAQNDKRYCDLALNVAKITSILEATVPKARKAYKLAQAVDTISQVIQEESYARDRKLTKEIAKLKESNDTLHRLAKEQTQFMRSTTNILERILPMVLRHDDTLKGVDVLLQNHYEHIRQIRKKLKMKMPTGTSKS
jgi:predicted transcriptional regulator